MRPVGLMLCLSVAAAERPQIAYQTGLLTARTGNNIKLGAAISFQSADKYGYGGRMVANGWDMFINWVNIERGGVRLNGMNYSFVLTYAEDYSDETYVRRAFEQYLQAYEMDFYLGPYSSGLTAAAVSMTEPAGRLMLAAVASNSSIFRGREFSFSMYPPDYTYDEVVFEVFSSLGAASIAIVQDVGYPQCDNVTASVEYAARYGINLYGHFVVDPLSATYSNDVTVIFEELKGAGVHVVHACSYLDLCIQVRILPTADDSFFYDSLV